MKPGNVTVQVRVLDRELTVAVPDSQRGELLACADYLNVKLAELKRSARVVGNDRLVMLAALNIAQELLAERAQVRSSGAMLGRFEALEQRLAAALADED